MWYLKVVVSVQLFHVVFCAATSGYSPFFSLSTHTLAGTAADSASSHLYLISFSTLADPLANRDCTSLLVQFRLPLAEVLKNSCLFLVFRDILSSLSRSCCHAQKLSHHVSSIFCDLLHP